MAFVLGKLSQRLDRNRLYGDDGADPRRIRRNRDQLDNEPATRIRPINLRAGRQHFKRAKYLWLPLDTRDGHNARVHNVLSQWPAGRQSGDLDPGPTRSLWYHRWPADGAPPRRRRQLPRNILERPGLAGIDGGRLDKWFPSARAQR